MRHQRFCYTVYWTPATNLDDPTSLTPTANPTDAITYTLPGVTKLRNCHKQCISSGL